MKVKFFFSIFGSLALTLIVASSLATAQTLTAIGDTYISSSGPDDAKNGSDGSRMISNDRDEVSNPGAGNTRYSYVRFDISALGPIASAKFDLVHVAGGNGFQTYEVFGLLEAEDDWDEATLTWNTSTNLSGAVLDVADTYGGAPLAPAFADDAAQGTGNGTVLTTFDAAGGLPVDFLNADSDGLVSFIIAEQIVGGTDAFGDGWASRENTTYNGPQLTVTVVPEPATGALLLGSLAALLGFRRRSR